MWKHSVEPNRSLTTIWCMRNAYRIPKATNTHSEYVILLFDSKSGFMNEAVCFVIRTLPVWSNITAKRQVGPGTLQ
jgi:hypothetical protein